MTTPPQPTAHAPAAAERAPPKVLFDWQDWLPFLEDLDAPEIQKRALIENYWAIILTFVDLGWEVGPPGPEETSGQVLDLTAALRATMVQSEEQPQQPSRSEAVGQESEEV